MSFTHPFALAFLPLAVLPLALYLWLKGRASTAPGDAVTFLLRRHTQNRPRVTAYLELILALARCLLVALIIVAFAGPTLSGTGSAKHGGLIVVLDDSASMQRVCKDGNNLFQHAKNLVDRTLRALDVDARVSLVTVGQTIIRRKEPVWVTRDVARRNLQRLRCGFWKSELPATVAYARGWAKETSQEHVHVLVVSDFAGGAHASLEDMAEDSSSTARVATCEQNSRGNVGVAGMRVTYVPRKPYPYIEAEVRVRNTGRKPGAQKLYLEILGRESVGTEVDCTGAGYCRARMAVPAKLEQGALVARLEGKDSYAPDDRWFEVFEARSVPDVLVVAPQERLSSWEARFVAAALRVQGPDTGTWRVRLAPPAELGRTSLEGVRLLILLGNAAMLDSAGRQVLDRFLQAGGGVLSTVGHEERSSETDLPAWLAPASVKRVVVYGDGPPLVHPVADADHPVFSGLESLREAVDQSVVHRVAVVSAPMPQGTHVWMRTTQGTPLAVERRVGKGRIGMFLSPLEHHSWDLPLRPGFAPFLRRVASYLAGPSNRRLPSRMLVGDTIFLPRDAVVKCVAGCTASRAFEPPRFVPSSAGVYEIRTGAHDYMVAVNVDPREAEFGTEPPHERTIEKGSRLAPQASADNAKRRLRREQRRGVTNWFVLAALALLLGEVSLRAWTFRRPST